MATLVPNSAARNFEVKSTPVLCYSSADEYYIRQIYYFSGLVQEQEGQRRTETAVIRNHGAV